MKPEKKQAVFVAFVILIIIFLVLAGLAAKTKERYDSPNGSMEPSALACI